MGVLLADAFEHSYIPEGVEDVLWLFPILNSVLLLVMIMTLNRRITQHDGEITERQHMIINMVSQSLHMQGLSADEAVRLAQGAADDRRKVANVARHLKEAQGRADAVDGTAPGQAADAASKSGGL